MENVWNGSISIHQLNLEILSILLIQKSSAVYLDVGNLIGYQQYPPHWIELLNSRIKRVQIKDYRENFDWTGSFSFCDIRRRRCSLERDYQMP